VTTFNRPVAFTGTDSQRTANRATHHWMNWDGEILCDTCEHKIWHVGADYPCGQEPMRETVSINKPALGDLHPGLVR